MFVFVVMSGGRKWKLVAPSPLEVCCVRAACAYKERGEEERGRTEGRRLTEHSTQRNEWVECIESGTVQKDFTCNSILQ